MALRGLLFCLVIGCFLAMLRLRGWCGCHGNLAIFGKVALCPDIFVSVVLSEVFAWSGVKSCSLVSLIFELKSRRYFFRKIE